MSGRMRPEARVWFLLASMVAQARCTEPFGNASVHLALNDATNAYIAFDEAGFETSIDYRRMLGIVARAGYRGYLGVEYEGRRLPEYEGIRATRDLILRIGAELSANGVQPSSNPS